MIDTPDPLRSRRVQRPRGRRRRGPTRRLDQSRRAATARRALKLIGYNLPGKEVAAAQQLLRQCLGRDPGSVARLCERARMSSPKRGDVVCFHRVGAPRRGGYRVGVVLGAQQREVSFVYLSGSRVRRGVLNPQWPHQRRVGHRIVNSYVRVKRPGDPKGSAYLAAELLAGYTSAAD